jgi:hypothetical protein
MTTPIYTVTSENGRMLLCIDGKPVPQHTYAYSYCNSFSQPGAKEILKKFVEHGCRTFVLCLKGGVDDDWGTTPFWTDDNVFPEDALAVSGSQWQETLDMAQYLIDLAPDVRFWLRCNCSPPKRWIGKFQDELLLNAYGKRYTEPSLASDRYDVQVRDFLVNMVRQTEAQPWADRLIGYLVYPLGEGTTQLTCEGFLFDQSPVMLHGFRDFLRRRYVTEASLQAAWRQAGVTLATAPLPHDEDFRQRGRVQAGMMVALGQADYKSACHRLHWPEPFETAPERDYCQYMRELTERNFRTLLQAIKRAAPGKLAGLDGFKQTMLGWPLLARSAGDYTAYDGAMHAVSGAFAMAALLEWPELDAVATPHDYLHRGMGFGYEGEGIGDSVILRKKMMLMEEDQRTHCRPEGPQRWNMLQSGTQVPAGLWRNFAAALSRAYDTYPMDLCGPSFFMGDDVQSVLGRRAEIQKAAGAWPRAEIPCIVMVLDDTSVLEEDFTIGYQNLAVIQQRQYGLARCGVPYRLHLFEDLGREDFPACHKVFLFPNLFRLTPERMTILRDKVFRDGNVAIFGPATGITDGVRLRADLVSEFLGIPLHLVRQESPRRVTVDRFDHPLTANLPRRIDYGDSYAYGPLLAPACAAFPAGPAQEPDVRRLGGIQWPSALDGPGLVIREFGRGAAGNGKPEPRDKNDYAVIFSAAVPLPAELLRAIAGYSGTHVYSDSDDDLIFADNCTLGIHSMRPGERTFRLPRPTAVWDLVENRKISDKTDKLTFHIEPPQTRLFYLGEMEGGRP